MKTILMTAAVLFGQLFASDTIDQVEFIGADGEKYFLRAATVVDIDKPEVGISDGNKPDRRSRVENGYFGVFIVEAEDGSFVRSIFTGRMPIGVQPWPCTEATDDYKRLTVIINFYDWLLSLHGIEPEHINVKRATAPDMGVELMNNSTHAATVVIPAAEPFNTVVLQDAVATLAKTLGYKVAPDADITPEGMPSFIISATAHKPLLSELTNSRVFKLPYYSGIDGMRYTTVTSMVDVSIPELPEEIVALLSEYTSSLSA